MLLRVGLTFIPYQLFVALIYCRLFGQDAVLPVILTVVAATVVSGGLLAFSMWAPSCIDGGAFTRNPFWAITVVTVVELLAMDVLGVIGAIYAGLRVVTGLQYLTMVGGIMTIVALAGLRPVKAWTLVLVGMLPLLFQPLALLFPSSWEAMHLYNFVTHFAFEIFGCSLFAAVTLVGSYRFAKAGQFARKTQNDIISEAAQSQALLETAMPPTIARALLQGAAPETLTQSFASASIAFVALEDFKGVGTDQPKLVLDWLDRVYTAFDGLVDSYGNGVNKVGTALL